jgi:hypothetical protein
MAVMSRRELRLICLSVAVFGQFGQRQGSLGPPIRLSDAAFTVSQTRYTPVDADAKHVKVFTRKPPTAENFCCEETEKPGHSCQIRCAYPGCKRAVRICKRYPSCIGIQLNSDKDWATLKKEAGTEDLPPLDNLEWEPNAAFTDSQTRYTPVDADAKHVKVFTMNPPTAGNFFCEETEKPGHSCKLEGEREKCLSPLPIENFCCEETEKPGHSCQIRCAYPGCKRAMRICKRYPSCFGIQLDSDKDWATLKKGTGTEDLPPLEKLTWAIDEPYVRGGIVRPTQGLKNCSAYCRVPYVEPYGYPGVAKEGDQGLLLCPSMFRDMADYVFGWPFEHFGENIILPQVEDILGCLPEVPFIYVQPGPLLKNFEREMLPHLENRGIKFMFFTGQSAIGVPAHSQANRAAGGMHSERLLNSPMLLRWWGQYPNAEHPKFEPIPVGLNCFEHAPEMYETLQSIGTYEELVSPSHKVHLLMINFSPKTHAVRQKLIDKVGTCMCSRAKRRE